MNFMNKKEVQLLLRQINFRPKKHLGQNFLISHNTVDSIISLSDLTQKDVVLEIGSGLGALTEKIASKVMKIYAVEIDFQLYSYLKKKFSHIANLEILNGDILKIDIPFHSKIVSNIPYKITGPILEKFFFKMKPPQGVMIIEKKIAERIFLTDEYKKLSRITIGLNSFMNPIFKKLISQNNFYPIPKIENTLIKIVPRKKIDPYFKDNASIEYYLKFIAGIMPYKNKNIVNAIELYFKVNFKNALTKFEISKILQENNYQNKKLKSFKIEDFIEISRLFRNLNIKT